jgi:hypothetical protein
MPIVRLGVVFGAFCLLGSCIPVDSEPPVPGSTQLQQLSSHQVVALCDWATDYMGGRQSNPDDAELGGSIVHRCPGDIGIPEDEREADLVYARFNYEACPTLLAAYASEGCTLTVSDYASWIEAIGDTPCEYHTVSNGQCTLTWDIEAQQ